MSAQESGTASARKGATRRTKIVFYLVLMVLVVSGLAWWSVKIGWLGGLRSLGKFELDGESLMSFCLGGQGDSLVVFLSTDQGNLYALDRAGKVLWRNSPAGSRRPM